MTLSLNVVVLLYLLASVCFIQALKGLSHPTTSRLGNLFGMVGMAIAVGTTIALIAKLAAEAGLEVTDTEGLAWTQLRGFHLSEYKSLDYFVAARRA